MLNSKLCDVNNIFIDFTKVNKIFESNNDILLENSFFLLFFIYKK